MSRSSWTGVLRRIRGTDEGAALVVVVGSMLVLAMLAMTALAYTLSSQRFSRYDQDYSAAMAAAQAGVDDFISRMDREATYGYAVDCTNPAWQAAPDPADPADPLRTCGWNASTPVGWQPVEPGASGEMDAYFHYAVDTSDLRSGSVGLEVTGRANGVYRTIQTTVGKGGSTDYVYYTDYESADPSNVQAYDPDRIANGDFGVQCGTGRNGVADAKYWHNGRNGRNCVEITFVRGDVLDGRVFTNDTILSDRATFMEPVQTADLRCRNAGASTQSWNQNCLRTNSTANFNDHKPTYATPKNLEDNSAAFEEYPGCHYLGATRIIFNANGTMTVWNSASVSGGADPVAIRPPGGTTPSCGTAQELNQPQGATIAVPDEMVVYVGNSTVANRQCRAGEIGGPDGRKLPLGTRTAAHEATPTREGVQYTADTNMSETTKYCGQGNLYVEGIVKGRVTLASEQSIIATGDLVTSQNAVSGTTDMIGLVATNSVEVFHPRLATVTSSKECLEYNRNNVCRRYGGIGWNTISGESEVGGWPKRYQSPAASRLEPASGIQIQGSIQTLQHSFLVQKYSVGGDKGTLLVTGSIAQRWRGIVGQNVNGQMNGYTKLYTYDDRLELNRPPYFPTWANAQWSLRASGEVNTPPEIRG